MLSYLDRFKDYAENIRRRTEEHFGSIESRKHRLEVSNVRLADSGADRIHDWASFQKAKETNGSFLGRVVGDVKLIHKETGKVVDHQKNYTMNMFPHVNTLGGYVVNGKELQVVNQLRRLPGVYPVVSSDNNVHSKITAAGLNHDVVFDRDSGNLLLKVKSSHLKLVPLLHEMGVSREALDTHLGKDLVDHNFNLNRGRSEMRRFHELTRRVAAPDDQAQLKTNVHDWLKSKALTSDVTKQTIGHAHEHVSPTLYLHSAKAAIDVANDKRKPADMESLSFKSLHSIEDFVDEKMKQAYPGLNKRVAYLMDRKKDIKSILSPGVLSKPIVSQFVTSEFTRYSDQNNPMDILGTMHTVTSMGEGGIQSTYAITDALRNVHNSHLGFIDTVHVPENGKIGVVAHLAYDVKKKGTQIYRPVFDTHTGKVVDVTPTQAQEHGLGFADQYKWGKDGKPKPKQAKVIGVKDGDLGPLNHKKIRYVLPGTESMFSIITNSIPFVNSVSANRVLMADRHLEQAVPLADREAPLVQSSFKNTPYDVMLGKMTSAIAEKAGRISGVKKDHILVTHDDGTKDRVNFAERYPLNSGAFLNMNPVVKTGQRVKKGQQLIETNFTKGGDFALGKNLVTAMLPWRGSSYEDGMVISESAAQKMASEHKHEFVVEKDKGVEVSHDKLFAHFPEERARHVSGADRSLPRVGQIFKPGDIVVPTITKVNVDPDTDYGRVHKALRSPYRNTSQYWDHDVNGEVTKVINTHGVTKVYVKTHEPMVIGDKLSTRAGSKGIVSSIIPNDQMPRTADGRIIDVLFNPYGMPGRVNPSLSMENAASKVARKTGKTFLAKSFGETGVSNANMVLAALAEHGLSDTEDVIDPTHGKTHKNVQVGENYWVKLRHQVKKKFSARSQEGPYTIDERPARGGHESAQSIGPLEIYSLLAGGNTAFLKDVAGLKSNRNTDYWSAFQMGLPTPQPKTPHILEKFETYLRGAGINLSKHGDTIKATPFTDAQILQQSRGALASPNVLRATKDGLEPERGGLFDKALTGGFDATHWNHIELPERALNPLYEAPVVALTGMKKKELDQYMAGTKFHEGKTGGEAIAHMLRGIDVKASLRQSQEELKSAKKTERNNILKKIRYLGGLDKLGLSAEEAYTNKFIPVVPTKFRPIYDLPDGSLNVADPNHGYREVLFVAKELAQLKKQGVDDEHLAPLRKGLYAAHSGLIGLTEPVTRGGNFKGFISNIAGTQNKLGLFQARVVKRRQDLSGRSTLINAPHLGMDEVGIPEEMGRSIYKPYLVRELVTVAGLKPIDARKEVEAGSERVSSLLGHVMRERPVMINRAPSLHKFSTISLIPHPVAGKAIQLNPLVYAGLNADVDGDTLGVHVPHSELAREELLKHLPSKTLLSSKTGDVQHMVSKEATLGLYMMTRPKEGAKPTAVSSEKEAIELMHQGKLDLNDPVTLKGKTWTPGHFVLNSHLPDAHKLDNTPVTGGKWRDLANDLAQSHPHEVGKVIDSFKDHGFDASTRLGFSVSLKAMTTYNKERDAIAKQVHERAKTDPREAIKWGLAQIEKLQDKIPDTDPFAMMTYKSGASNKHKLGVRQMTLAPVGFTDSKGEILPVPIMSSYADGLDSAQYWATLPSSRKGIADRAVSTQETGAFAKELLNTTIGLRINATDCGTHRGIPMTADHPDIVGRYLAGAKPVLITQQMAQNLRKEGRPVSVRSPMTCQLQDGICQHCMGLNASGKQYQHGFHIGALAGTTISEPITQMVLRNFHTGGAVGTKEVGFKRIRQIFSMPENIKGKATLAAHAGEIQQIKDTGRGGWDVYVDGLRHFVPKETGLRIKVGDSVKRGDSLSDHGVLKMQEVAELRGHDAARDQLIHDLDTEMSSAGQNIRRRIYEVAAKPMVDKVKIVDPGDAHDHLVEGDVVNVNYLKQLNQRLKKPAEYQPIIMSVKEVPFSGGDFLGPLMYQRLPRTMAQAPALGFESKLKGPGSHPIVEYAYGGSET